MSNGRFYGYQFKHVGNDGQTTATSVFATDDACAMRLADLKRGGTSTEVWENRRLVGRIVFEADESHKNTAFAGFRKTA